MTLVTKEANKACTAVASVTDTFWMNVSRDESGLCVCQNKLGEVVIG